MSTLQSYVPRLVARRLAAVSADPDEPHSDQMTAALLLVDITGFTSVTAAAVRRGTTGTEQLSRALNAYLGQIIDVVTAHGGDVVKIVGDAIIPMWPADGDDLGTVSRRAAACGLTIARELDDLEIQEGERLSVKVGLCAGEVVLSRVGGLDGRWLFVVSGHGIDQLPGVGRRMLTGSVVASREAWSLISTHFVGERLDAGHARIRSMQRAPELRPLVRTALDADHERAVRAFIPQVVLARLDAGQGAWLAELRRTTVIFANVRGTGAGRADALAQLQALAAGAQRAADRYDGWLKEITVDEKGTTLVAAFGVPPFSHEDDATRAIRAALAIRAEIQAAGMSAGIGVATGSTFCGPVGNASRRDFVVLGQHVNLAARLMQAAGQDGVLCDRATQEDSHGLEDFEQLPAYVLKGVGSPTDVFRVRFGEETPVDRSSDLVDRIGELAAALKALRSLREGAGGVMVLEGEPGIGKSRLAVEIARQARATAIRTLVGRGAEIESSTPYHAWRAVFEQLIGLDAVRDPATRRDVVLDRLSHDEETRLLAPLLDPVLSLDLPDNDTTIQLSGAVRADNTHDLLVHLLGQEASKGPMLLLLEDAQWLDSASWTVLDRIELEIPSLLIFLNTRPLGDTALEPVSDVLAGATTLRLTPLVADDVLTLACRRTGASRLSSEVADLIQQRAEGNPLFVEQLTYAMRDAGRIVVENGLCRAAGGDGLETAIIPDTLQRVIVTRLDQLPPAEAMTLKVASVIGQQFVLRTLHDIHPVPTEEAVLVIHLQTLTRLDLVEPLGAAAEPTYQFRHVITQEVAYNLMPSDQLTELHRRLAEWYERVYAADLTPFHTILAHHWQRAGSPARAVDHLERAGDQALRTFANEEAIDFFRQALALVEGSGLDIDPGRRARWQLRLGEANVHMSRYREGRQHLDEGLRLLGRPTPGSDIAGGFLLADEVLRQALRRAGVFRRVRKLSAAERDELILVCHAYERLAEASYYSGATFLALYCAIRILNDAEASRSAPEIARGFAGSGALLGVIPLPRLAEWYSQRALRRLEQVDELTTHEIVEIVVGFYYIGAAKWDQARQLFRSVRRNARRLGDRRRLDDAIHNLMELEYLQGNIRMAAAFADELSITAEARDDQRFLAEALIGRAYSSWLFGDVTAALARIDEVRHIMERTDLNDDVKLKYFGLQALIQLSRAEMTAAHAASEEAMRITRGLRPSYFGNYLGFAGPAEVYLTLWRDRYPVGDPRAAALEALRRFRRFAAVFPVGRPRYRLLDGRRAWLQGHRRRAERAWRRSLAEAEELGMTYEQARVHLEFAEHLEDGGQERAAHLRAGTDVLQQTGVQHPTSGG